MKKFLLVVAVAGIMTSCKDKKKTEETVVTPTTTTELPTTTTTEPTTTTTAGGVPSFKDADVQAYAQAYSDYADSYKKAAESKDMSKFTELSKMGQDLAAKATAMSQKLATTPEDAQKLSDFIVAKTKEITEYTKKMTGM